MTISNFARTTGALAALTLLLVSPAAFAETKAAPVAAPAAAPTAAAPAPEAVQDAVETPAEAAAPAEAAPAPRAAGPAPTAQAAPAKPAPAQAAAPAAAPAQPEAAQAKAPATAPAPASASAANLKSIAIGSAVVGTDGKKIGVINRVVSDASGAVLQIHVAPGGTAGIGVPVIAVPANRIASAGAADVKLSLSSDEASKLPIEGRKG